MTIAAAATGGFRTHTTTATRKRRGQEESIQQVVRVEAAAATAKLAGSTTANAVEENCDGADRLRKFAKVPTGLIRECHNGGYMVTNEHEELDPIRTQ